MAIGYHRKAEFGRYRHFELKRSRGTNPQAAMLALKTQHEQGAVFRIVLLETGFPCQVGHPFYFFLLQTLEIVFLFK